MPATYRRNGVMTVLQETTLFFYRKCSSDVIHCFHFLCNCRCCGQFNTIGTLDTLDIHSNIVILVPIAFFDDRYLYGTYLVVKKRKLMIFIQWKEFARFRFCNKYLNLVVPSINKTIKQTFFGSFEKKKNTLRISINICAINKLCRNSLTFFNVFRPWKRQLKQFLIYHWESSRLSKM